MNIADFDRIVLGSIYSVFPENGTINSVDYPIIADLDGSYYNFKTHSYERSEPRVFLRVADHPTEPSGIITIRSKDYQIMSAIEKSGEWACIISEL
jgi:hypothetical protein